MDKATFVQLMADCNREAGVSLMNEEEAESEYQAYLEEQRQYQSLP